MTEWLARLRDWLRRDTLDRELTEELRFHREQLEREAQALGATTDAAHFAARRRLGSELRVREASRERWSWPGLDHVQQDVRYAWRGLRRSPGFTITVVLTFALGIGANAAMFGVMDRLMFRPFPYLNAPGQVNRVYLVTDGREGTNVSAWTEYARFLDLKQWTGSFSQYAAHAQRWLAVGLGDAARERPVALVNASLFDFFAARPVLGRFFDASEDTTPRGAAVAVLSYGFWQSEFGGQNVIGQRLDVRNISTIIIGVAPKGFVGVSEGEAPAIFLPITTYAGNDTNLSGDFPYYRTYRNGWVQVIVRRKAGISEAQAGQDLSNAHARSWSAMLAVDQPGGPPVTTVRPRAIAGPVKTAAGPNAGLESKTLFWVAGVAAIVLLIACANVANLMFARVLRRRRETAVRLALGVSRGRLLAQSYTECLLLAGLGCLAGVLVAEWGGAVLGRLFLSTGASFDVATDRRTLTVAVVIALLAALVTGVAPAYLATRDDLTSALKAGTREGTRQRSWIRSALLVCQAALSVILLVGAGLFVQSLFHARQVRLGFDPESLVLVGRELRGMQLPDNERAALGWRLLENAQAVPGISHASLVSSVPFWSTSSVNLFVSGIDTVRKLGYFTYQTASPDYFATTGTRILRGRGFSDQDRRGSPWVTVVSQSMAAAIWPKQEALGQCIRVRADTLPCRTVVGVAENTFQMSLSGDEKSLRFYLPLDQYEPARANYLLLRVQGEPVAQVERVRKALQAVMPGTSYVRVRALLASDVALNLGIAPLVSDTLEIVTSTGRVKANPALVPQLEIGPLLVRNAPAMIVEESMMQMREPRPSEQSLHVKIDGIIGFDIIRQLDLEVDFSENILRLRNPAASRPDADRNMFWVGLPVVRLTSTDGIPLHFGLDTGAQLTFVTETLLDKLSLQAARIESRRVGGLGGEISVRAPVLPDLRVMVRQYPILFRGAVVRAPVYQVLASLDGVLGGDVWNSGIVRIDMTNGVFAIRRPRPN